jgi:Arc/MetJ-type ribon-helix-helix transcriptional regulator
MTARKERMTVTVDRALVEAASEAVASGRASSISTWVNAALTERAAKDRHLRAMAEALAGYEAEFGEISAAELVSQQRNDRRTAIAVRESRKKPARGHRRRAA